MNSLNRISITDDTCAMSIISCINPVETHSNTMAEPIVRKFNQSKDAIIDAFPTAAEDFGMRMLGCHYELGMLSFGKEGRSRVYHAHVIEKENKSTQVEIAPGFSFMKDRKQSELPVSTIENFMDRLNMALKDPGS